MSLRRVHKEQDVPSLLRAVSEPETKDECCVLTADVPGAHNDCMFDVAHLARMPILAAPWVKKQPLSTPVVQLPACVSAACRVHMLDGAATQPPQQSSQQQGTAHLYALGTVDGHVTFAHICNKTRANRPISPSHKQAHTGRIVHMSAVNSEHGEHLLLTIGEDRLLKLWRMEEQLGCCRLQSAVSTACLGPFSEDGTQAVVLLGTSCGVSHALVMCVPDGDVLLDVVQDESECEEEEDDTSSNSSSSSSDSTDDDMGFGLFD